ncbi:MAG: TonB-dependent receptor [Candidatus Eremiobacteraeota bacterium]|nr:TonB-dependent receptor [Candidatus Eremiobacteraeota bacterium]
MRHSFLARCTTALLMLVLFLSVGIAPATSQALSTIRGSLIDQASGLPIAGAQVDLIFAEKPAGKTTSDQSGGFSFSGLMPGIYHLEIRAQGFESGRSDDVFAVGGGSTTIRTALNRAKFSQSSSALHEIGSVNSTHETLQTSSTISQTISAQQLEREATLRVGDALQNLPGVSSFDLDSAPGDDLGISIRGFKPSEAQALIDGHPVGPIGVSAGGGTRTYNYQLSPSSALNNIQVEYGTSGLSLYGIDAIAGTIDFQTMNPTKTSQVSVNEGIGSFGRAQTTVKASGTFGKLGYALEGGLTGTYGGFKNDTFSQNALLAGSNTPSGLPDVSPTTVAANTWNVTGNYIVRNGLLKLRYDLHPNTALTFTAYSAASFDDKTGNGDNDAWSPEYTGYVFDHTAGTTPGCAGVSVITANDAAGNATASNCYTRSQYVSAFSGAFGGTPLAYQSLRNQDYSLRLSGHRKNAYFTGDVFLDTFNTYYDRNQNGFINNYLTVGEKLGEEFVTEKNTLGFGIFGYGQTLRNSTYTTTGHTDNPSLENASFNYYVRDSWNPSARFAMQGSAWLKNSSVTGTTALLPRLSMTFHPDPNDVIRVSAGKAQGIPNIGLKSLATAFNQTPSNINPNCTPTGVTSVANAPNPNLKPETGTDLELSFGHRFHDDSSIQVIGFDMSEQNVIFSSVLPLASLGITPPPGLTFGPGGYLSRIAGCNPAATVANLGATAPSNAGGGRYRGFDITGRLRASKKLYFDYSYDALSAKLFNEPIIALQSDPTLLDGQQLNKVPIHKASIGFDFSDLRGLEVRVDGYFVGSNNALLRPAYSYANGSITKDFKNLTLNIGVSNIFNSVSDRFGQFGLATFQPENRYGTDASALDQAFAGLPGAAGERFGLPPRTIVFSITRRI